MIDSLPALIAVQPEGNRALVKAMQSGLKLSQIVPEAYPKSVASGLLDPYPWDGDAALEGVRATRGAGVWVSDREIMDAVKDLASLEGVFAEPSGAAGLAGMKKMAAEGGISKDDRVVVLVTGSGLKDPDTLVAKYSQVRS